MKEFSLLGFEGDRFVDPHTSLKVAQKCKRYPEPEHNTHSTVFGQ